LADAAKETIVLDGSGMKNTLERMIIKDLAAEGTYLRKGTKVLLVSAVDRFGMAEALAECGCDTIFGDLMFGLGIPIPIRTMTTVRIVAAVLLPVLTRLPIEWLYPTGKKQHKSKPEFKKYFDWADVIAGDFLYINRKRPPELPGKTIITNTVTRKNEEELKQAGVKTLISTTPEFEGRSFGTNVFEGICAALLGRKAGEMPTEEEYMDIIKKMNFGPRIKQLA
ncbi:MAG: quinate 5-dehydrogenase, partial [bacterium]